MVHGITTEVTRQTLWRHFGAYGSVDSVQVRHELKRALLTFRNPDAVMAAMTSMDGKVFCCQTMSLRFADTPPAPTHPKTVAANLGGEHDQASVDTAAGAVGGESGLARTASMGFVAKGECPPWRKHGWCRYGLNCHMMHLP